MLFTNEELAVIYMTVNTVYTYVIDNVCMFNVLKPIVVYLYNCHRYHYIIITHVSNTCCVRVWVMISVLYRHLGSSNYPSQSAYEPTRQPYNSFRADSDTIHGPLSQI